MVRHQDGSHRLGGGFGAALALPAATFALAAALEAEVSSCNRLRPGPLPPL